ncbi:hypothetical protein [Dysgonomonas sp. 216]|uniref:hypothetical protein n=1 Tax=Dysgonomonas sp. 216 TaxID=2302934 RepID=UPI0013D26214|nr:hypothetical protein [Dysgonomonas sp. 216]
MKKILLILLVLVVIFYHIYPQALPVFGYTFIVLSGAIGLTLYVRDQFPYDEAIRILIVYGLFAAWAIFSVFMNGRGDSYLLSMTKTQIAWFFSSFFIIILFFLAHPKGSINTLFYYIIGAILLQCIITVVMYFNESVAAFFNSIHKMDYIAIIKREETKEARLLGYGIAFFGAGITCGLGLILIAYLVMTQKMNILQIVFAALVYTFIAYIGLFSARTTMIGAAASLALIIILFITGAKHKNQFYTYIISSVILMIIGYSLCYIYFEEFADWAFEAFINYQEKGKFTTQSSTGLEQGIVTPTSIFTWFFGKGTGEYFGIDIGFTRLLFWVGLPGTLLYFYYLYMQMKFALSKNKALNYTFLVTYAYVAVLNWKGLADLTYFFLLVTFYFLHYKYHIYQPYLYSLGYRDKTKLRNAFQTSPASRRV